jgi:hypothetical protein
LVGCHVRGSLAADHPPFPKGEAVRLDEYGPLISSRTYAFTTDVHWLLLRKSNNVGRVFCVDLSDAIALSNTEHPDDPVTHWSTGYNVGERWYAVPGVEVLT